MNPSEPLPTTEELMQAFLAQHPGAGREEFEAWVQEQAHGQEPGGFDELEGWLGSDAPVPELADEAHPETKAAPAPAGPLPGVSRVGDRIGSFVLRRFIAQGGMGQVWEAFDENMRRSVALKLVLPDRTDDHSLDLFAREARAGGRLVHPALVATLDHGIHEGRAWIAQELVPGADTLKDYLDEVRGGDELPVAYYRDVAELIATLAQGLGAAHEVGVIHRDVKPQNILLDAQGKPKLTDFGLARVMDDSFHSNTGEFAGTWAYMSPEQVTAKRMGLDHRTDVFSLGVVFYELLSLRRPFEGDTAHQIAARIITHDPPNPALIRSKCPRDLGVIVGKTLEKSPDRRYASMAELADDIGRFLEDRPITAQPPGRVDRARKWIRRNPTLSASGSVALVGLVLVSGLSIQLSGEKERLELQTRQLAEVVDYQANLLSSLDPTAMGVELRSRLLSDTGDVGPLEKFLAGRDFTGIALHLLHTSLFEGALAALESFDEQPLVQAQLLQTLASAMLGLGLSDPARDPQVRALDLRREHLGPEHPQALQSAHALGLLELAAGNLESAREIFEDTLATRIALLGEQHASTLQSLASLGNLHSREGRVEDAEPLLLRALAGRRATLGMEHSKTLESISHLGVLYNVQGRSEDATASFTEVLEVQRRTLPESANLVGSLENLGVSLMAAQDWEGAEPYLLEALALARRVLGNDHPDTLLCLTNAGALYLKQGKYAEAEPIVRTGFEQCQRLLGETHPDTLQSLNNLAALFSGLGRSEESLEALQQVATRSLQAFGPENLQSLTAALNLGVACTRADDLDQARAEFEQAHRGFEALFGSEDGRTVTALHYLTFVLFKQGLHAEALPKAQALLKVTPEDSPVRALRLELLADIEAALQE